MLTLLAESKTMSGEQYPITDLEIGSHTPVLEPMADAIMEFLATKSPPEIASKLGISTQLAVKAHTLAYEFPHKLTGYSALKAFIGEAYRALDIQTIPAEKLEKSKDNLRIISSVYGILKPDDIIKPYRFEFNKNLTQDNKTPIQLFKSKNTVDLVNFIKGNKISDIIDLLPGEADKCVDWKIIRAFASVHKICFQIITPEGRLKTPIAKRLKELRGLMYRFILENDVQSFQQLISTESDHFFYSPKDSKPGLPVFISD
ncbi:MAG: YaaA family protein [Muribaculaceae bacterium]|nr:YaaA family protein [Muribaculaceae bacterium]